MLRKILDFDLAKGSESDVHGHLHRIDALDFELFHQVLTEVQRGHWCGYGSLNLGKNALVALGVCIFERTRDVLGQWSLSHLFELHAELFIASVKEEAERTTARRRIVDDLGHKAVIIPKVEFVSDSDFAGGIHQHIPKTALGVEFAKQEHLDQGTRLFFVAPHTGRKNLCVVDHQKVAWLKEIGEVAKVVVLNASGLPIHHHQARVVAKINRMLRDLRFRQFVAKVGELHFHRGQRYPFELGLVKCEPQLPFCG